MTTATQPIYPQDAAPWYVQMKKGRGDWETIGIVPRANHTRSEALQRYAHLEDFGKLRAVSKSQAYADYQAGRAGRPEPAAASNPTAVENNVCAKCRQATAPASGNLCEACASDSGGGEATARPWRASFATVRPVGSPAIICDCYPDVSPENAAANAALIVQAVNSFDVMREALRDARACLADNAEDNGPILREIDDALALADPQQPESEAQRIAREVEALGISNGKPYTGEDYRSTRGQHPERGHKDMGCPVTFCGTCAEKRKAEQQ